MPEDYVAAPGPKHRLKACATWPEQRVKGGGTRREVLVGIVAAALARAASRKIPIGLQLFSVRNQCAADLPRTLARVKQIGFEGVELAGDYGHSGPEFRRYLDANALVCCGEHVSFEMLQPDRYGATVAFAHAIGAPKVIVPGLPAKYTNSLDGWREVGGIFAGWSDRLRKDGLELGYHNHSHEFKTVDGERPLDVFLGACPNVFLELDIGGAGYGGANAVEILHQYRRRVRMIHTKDYTATQPDVIIGTGSTDWPALLRNAQSAAVEWFVIEHDSISGPDLADMADSYQRFRNLLARQS